MRNIINISLPAQMAKSVRREVEERDFATTSEFFRYLFRQHTLARELNATREQFAKGKGKVLHSLRDLR